jgi:hypothetical protein
LAAPDLAAPDLAAPDLAARPPPSPIGAIFMNSPSCRVASSRPRPTCVTASPRQQVSN